MIVGKGQIAQAFKDVQLENTVIFASGVANSNCVEKEQFERENDLLVSTLLNNPESKFVYFSSCALSAAEYPKNAYYQHKQHMEEVIKSYVDSYYIFRVPQLFGCLQKHATLINFIYHSVVKEKSFNVYHPAYRYVIELSDVVLLVDNYLRYSKQGVIVNLFNDYRYNVEELVKTFELLLEKEAKYTLVEKSDGYYLEHNDLNQFIMKHKINVSFGSDYFRKKIKERIIELSKKE